MAKNALTIFYEGEGKVRAVAKIFDNKKSVDQNTYTNRQTNCDQPTSVCYLDDPYEGELFTFMLYFYSPWNDSQEREKLWSVKSAKLQSAEFTIDQGTLTVQKGWWFSAHETWKYLFLPYLYESTNHKVFLNGEKMRTWDAVLNKRPGMHASVNGLIS